jgi:cytochrome b pre-mRNA-processing protein 3
MPMNAAKQGHARETLHVSWFAKLFGSRDEAELPLYTAIIARARMPHWYEAGAVPDSIDGRFDMVAAILAFVLLRFEGDPIAAAPSASLTERFVDDMDGQLREIGIGDVVVGKHIGKMMSMLGGRLGAYRDGLASGDLDSALARNLYRGVPPGTEALGHVRESLLAFRDALAAAPIGDLIAGELP